MKKSLCVVSVVVGMILLGSMMCFAGTIERVGLEGWDPSISADGRYVAFGSNVSNLVPGDTNNTGDIFVYDRVTGITERVSIDNNGNEANGLSYYTSISADGRYVAFGSDASNLVVGDTNGFFDIFVHDRATGITERVSIDSNGNEANNHSSWRPSISADGRCVAFMSNATNLVPGGTIGAQIFVHDRVTGITGLVSVDSNGNQVNDFIFLGWPSISADGRYVTFWSYDDDLVPGDNNGMPDVFVHDRVTKITERVNVDSNGNEANDWSYDPSISADGRYVGFSSRASNLVSGDTNGVFDIFVHDRVTGMTERVSVDSNGNEANGFSDEPSINADGRYVAFESVATNLIAGGTTNPQTFIHDRVTGKNKIVSVSNAGIEGNSGNAWSLISADGRNVVFYSTSSNLVPGDTNNTGDIFVWTRGLTIPPRTTAELTAYIQDLVEDRQLDPGIANSLTVKIDARNAGSLQAFISQTQALSGKKIPEDIAAVLIEAAQYIIGTN